MGHPITSSSIKPPSRALLETLKVPPSDRNAENVAAIDDAVGGHPFFASLSKETRLSLVQNLTVEAFRKDRAVVLQDDRADAFYVVFSGDVDVFISDAKFYPNLRPEYVELVPVYTQAARQAGPLCTTATTTSRE